MDYYKNNLQVILDSEPDIDKWFNKLVSRGRKYNLSLVIGNEKLELKKDGYKEIINLDNGLDQIKLDLLSLKEKYPIPPNNSI